MNQRFREMVEGLEAKCNALLAMKPVIASNIPKDTPEGGVYLFSEGPTYLYAGRTKRAIGMRIRDHYRRAPDCPFAWLLAREGTGKKRTYRPEGSRKALLADPFFKVEYERAKDRIRKMDVRYVHEPHATSQALLEIYVAVSTQARYNDFDVF